MLEELFENIQTRKDRDKFVAVLKTFEDKGYYDIINGYSDSAKADILSLIAYKAKVVGETAYWRAKQKIFIKNNTKGHQISNETLVANENANFTTFTDQPIELYCGEWVANDEAIYKVKGNEIVIASKQPILITKRYINIENNSEKFELSFYDEGRWKTKIVPRTIIANASNIIKLVDYGIDVASDTAFHLCSYLNLLYTSNKDIIPIVNSISRLGWLDDSCTTFMPYTETNITFDVEGENKKIIDSVREEGDFNTWLDIVKQSRKVSPILRIVMASSFASPLIFMLNTLGFITHLYGDRGTGKTLSLMMAVSIWGSPTQGDLFSTINNTLFAIESRAEILQNIPFSGDELHNLKIKESNYDEFIYMIANGQGKGRGSKDLSLQKSKTWKLAAITTGEDKITKDNSHSGSKVRTVEIEATGDLFPGLVGRNIASTLRENYGFAGRMFIEEIIKIGKEELKRQYKEIEDEFLEQTDDKIDAKQLNAICTIVLADRIATSLIFKDNLYLQYSDFKRIIKTESEINVSIRAYEYICDIIGLNKNKFCIGEESANSYNEIWGEIQPDFTIINKQILKRELAKEGYSLTEILTRWEQAGYIKLFGNRNHFWSTKFKCNCIKILNPPSVF